MNKRKSIKSINIGLGFLLAVEATTLGRETALTFGVLEPNSRYEELWVERARENLGLPTVENNPKLQKEAENFMAEMWEDDSGLSLNK